MIKNKVNLKTWGVYWAKPIGWLLAKCIYNTTVIGAKNVPKNIPLIFAANHTSYLDGPLMVGVAPRYMHVMVKKEIFFGFLKLILIYSGQIPLNTSGDRNAMYCARSVLNQGKCLGILPEGRRCIGNASRLNTGIAWLAIKTKAPVIPVAILGTRIANESRDKIAFPRRKIYIVFGLPYIFKNNFENLNGRKILSFVKENIRKHLSKHIKASINLTGMKLPDDSKN